MRQKRAKAYRKLMSLYSMSFGFRQPYQVLVDSHMCKEAITRKIELVKQLGVVLQGTVKPMITQCCIHELYLQGHSQQPAVDLAKTFERRKCNHREPIAGESCLESVVGKSNQHRYVVATQSQELRQTLRAIPAVPIVHVNRSVMILEPPSETTLRVKVLDEEKALHPTAPEAAKLSSVVPTVTTEPSHKKRKGPKGPNPLSVKKKKLRVEVGQAKKDNSDSKAKVGEKRKLDEGDVAEDSTVKSEAMGHKRKRRKRSTASIVEQDGDRP